MSGKQFIFRNAKVDDMKVIIEMIKELAEYEKMSDTPELTEEDLIRDSGLTGGQEYCHIYILELQKDNVAPEAVGYTICYFSYSTWRGRSYFLQDLYVRSQFRGLGAGAHIIRGIAAKAKEYNCKRIDFHVLAWNPATKFYAKMGAINLTDTENWHYYRLKAQQIEKLANEL